MSEIVIDERPPCPRCGGPMSATLVFLCGPGAPGGIDLPPTCDDPSCRRRGQAERDEAAIARAVAAGVINP